MSGHLRPPFEDAPEHTSRYGPMYWSALVVGSVFMSFGLVSLLSKAGATEPLNFSAFFIGLALVHDLLLAPAIIAFAVVLRRASPRAGRGVLFGSVIVSAIVVLFSLPMLFGWGAQPDNPSFLPRNYALGLSVVLAAVWGLAAALLIGRMRRRSS